MDQVILDVLGFQQGVARYAVAYRLIDAPLALSTAAGGVMFALLARAAPEQRARVGRIMTARFVVAGYAGGTLVFLFAPQLVAILGGPAYGGAAWPARLLSPVILASIMNIGPAFVVITQGAVRQLLRIAILGVVLNLVLNLLMIPRLGIDGAAVSTVVTEALGFVLVSGVAARSLPGSGLRRQSLVALLAFCAGSFGGLASWEAGAPLIGVGLMTVASAVVARELQGSRPPSPGTSDESCSSPVNPTTR
jgi:O-antigen/teichoic acid export membrane protein